MASKLGNLGTIELLMRKGEIDVNAKWWRGGTALHDASCYGHAQVVKLRLESNEIQTNRTDARHQFASSHLAALMGDIGVVRCLLEDDGIDVNVKDRESGQTARHIASALGDLEIIGALLWNENCDDRILDFDGYFPVELALSEGHEKAVGKSN